MELALASFNSTGHHLPTKANCILQNKKNITANFKTRYFKVFKDKLGMVKRTDDEENSKMMKF